MRRQTATLATARTGSRLMLVPPGQRERQHCRVVSVEDGVLRCAAIRGGAVFSVDRNGFYVSR